MVASDKVLVTGQAGRFAINTIRNLAIDAVTAKRTQAIPALPMGLAPWTYCLVAGISALRSCGPHLVNRDRFVLSNGHASMLLYACSISQRCGVLDKNGKVF